MSVDVHNLLVVEQSSLESQSRGCAKTPILTIRHVHRDAVPTLSCFVSIISVELIRHSFASDVRAGWTSHALSGTDSIRTVYQVQ